jgi:hypothetical protein
VTSLRAFFRQHSSLALWLVMAALCLKALVPAGYMIDTQASRFAIEICDGQGGHSLEQIIVPGAAKTAQDKSGAAKADQLCPFSVLSLAMLGGADPVLLALALLFLMALGLRRAPMARPRGAAYLRPPTRAPPVLA